jgi:hypothetical protein
MSLKSDLDKLALALVAQANGAELEEQIDIFKAVSAYHLGNERGKKKGEDEPTGATFGGIVDKLKNKGVTTQ